MTSQMPDPDPKKATATIVLNGLFLMWLNPWGDLEIGFVKCPGHPLNMKICKVKREESRVSCDHISDPPTCQDNTEIPVPPVGQNRSMDVQVVGAARYKPVAFFPDFGVPFVRVADPPPHENHFDWMFDMTELHQGKVGVNPHGFSARMRINSGLVYTACLSEQRLNLLTWKDSDDHGTLVRKFGPVAEKTAVQIECDPDVPSGLFLVIPPHRPIWLPNNPELTYEILLQNSCQPSPPNESPVSSPPGQPPGTHFRHLYLSGAIVTPTDEPKYDFEIAKAVVPEVCNGAFIGRL